MIKVTIEVESENVDELKKDLTALFNEAIIRITEESGKEYVEDLSAIEIRSFKGFECRVYNRFKFAGINTFADLVKVEPCEILNIRQMGPYRFKSVVGAINEWLVDHPNKELESWVKKAEKELE